MLRNISKNCCLILGSLFVGFLIIEFVLRLFVPLPSLFMLPDSRLIKDERGFWLNLPAQKQVFSNNVDFNGEDVSTYDNGLRQVPCRPDKLADETPRIYIFGDSQTYGWGLSDSDTWPNQLQCLLNKSGEQFAVVNLGVPGTNLDQYYYRTRMVYDFVRPKDILIYMITWNDWHSDQSNIRPISLNGKCGDVAVVDMKPMFCPLKPTTYYGKKSSWRQSLYDKTGLLIPAFDSLKAFSDTVVFSSAVAHLMIPPMKALYLRYRKSDTIQRIGTKTLKSNDALVQQIAKDTAKTEHVYFAFLPSRISYADKTYNVYSKNRTVFKNQDFLFGFAKEGCEQNGLNCFSLFAALHAPDIGIKDFKFDGHLNVIGAKAVARSVFGNVVRPTSGKTH
ncbi:MAG: hypothetical protein CMM52_06040 [Rhodospirillaceae bacterium]|nr:hypothetical protein [Rhodospirillaceae bacterium]|tara:strand:- start:16530 stop:17702 length:1173 start_codon:yes stop_codon:yes gene_type:complete